MPVMSWRVTGRPHSEPLQDPIEAVFARAAGAARRPEHRPAARRCHQHEIAGIDRHAEMLDGAADRLDGRRNDVAPVRDRGSAEHDHQFHTARQHRIERSGERRGLVRDAAFRDDLGTGRREPVLRDPEGLFDHLVGEARQHRRDDADMADPVGRDAHQGLARARRKRRVARRRADRERNDFYGRDHLVGHNRRKSVEGRERDIGIDRVEAVDTGAIDHDDAGGFGEQIGAPRKGAIDPHTLARDRARQFRGGDILGNIARLDRGRR